MIIGIDMGHTLNPGNYGAVGIKNESEETRNVGNRLIKYLECMGHTVVDVTVDYADSPSESLRRRVEAANAQPLDLFVSLHFNAFDGERNGSEVYTYRGRRLPQAVNVLGNLAELGFKPNGIFDGSNLYVIKRTNAPAMLVEIAYIDSPIDMAIYDPELVAQALARGITGQEIPAECLNVNSMSRTRFEESDKLSYMVTVGGCLKYSDARDLTIKLKDEGYTVSLETIT